MLNLEGVHCLQMFKKWILGWLSEWQENQLQVIKAVKTGWLTSTHKCFKPSCEKSIKVQRIRLKTQTIHFPNFEFKTATFRYLQIHQASHVICQIIKLLNNVLVMLHTLESNKGMCWWTRPSTAISTGLVGNSNTDEKNCISILPLSVEDNRLLDEILRWVSNTHTHSLRLCSQSTLLFSLNWFLTGTKKQQVQTEFKCEWKFNLGKLHRIYSLNQINKKRFILPRVLDEKKRHTQKQKAKEVMYEATSS